MEWEKINTDALKEVCKVARTMEEMKAWAMEKNNFFLLGQRIIGLAEQSKIFAEFTTLNDDFKKRLKDKNRYQDEKEIGEKRPMNESPSKLTWSPDWSMSEIAEDPKKHKIWADRLKEQVRSKLLSFTPEVDEDEETEIERPSTPPTPSKKASGSSNKRKGKKKRK
ncbi:hypothetical protein RhiirA1_469075 [Rhizophagus irregularis]|uniref:Uncharacterized protein n=1 Tax=Rhizophagus irregularis TaxID=588596 RepID=A0A2I1F218_9GLOM|nr:hypothetical protein RhiirA1_469075 [Rhizophagus irregularis]PKY28426.1 hypothetical protein RhiirB3_444589 [Rhizophagus irregularis]CAB4479501.1 unnamed protein product [Rhizophagus irregularis]